VGRLEGNFIEVDGKVEAARAEMKNMHDEMKNMHDEMKNIHDEMKQDQQEVKKEVRGLKANIWKMNKDVDDVKVMMNQVLQKLNMLELLNKEPPPTAGMLNTPRQDILIVGGDDIFSNTGSCTEIYSWEKNCWFKISPMDEEIEGAS
jgi:chromosome segregation ATPase